MVKTHKITLQKLLNVASLARLKLTPADQKKFLPQLNSIFGYIQKITAVDTANTKPTFQTTLLDASGRPDTLTSSLSAKQVLSSAPHQQDDYFKVKATIKK